MNWFPKELRYMYISIPHDLNNRIQLFLWLFLVDSLITIQDEANDVTDGTATTGNQCLVRLGDPNIR